LSEPKGRINQRARALRNKVRDEIAVDPRLELAALALLAAFGCGLALSQDNLLFATIFGAACAASIFEEIRRFP
jgi:hypothetical protein